MTDALVAAVPVGNLRVLRAEFAAVWADAERRATEAADRGVTDWYAGGIAVTCRWLAGAVVTDDRGRRELARSPATWRAGRAYEELIDDEYLVAERLAMTRPDLLEHRPGWCEAIRATLRWAWRHVGPPPFAAVQARPAG